MNSGQIWERLSIRAEVCRTIPQNWQLRISCCVWQHYQTEWLSSLPNVFVVRVETKTSAVADASLKSRHPFASTDDRAECFFLHFNVILDFKPLKTLSDFPEKNDCDQNERELFN